MIHDAYPNGESEKSTTDGIRERALASIKGGKLGELVKARTSNYQGVLDGEPTEVLANVAEILKPSTHANVVRWVELHNLDEIPADQEEIIFSLADEFGLRLPVGHELPIVEDPLLIVEGGANRTSVVRRGLAEQMLAEDGGVIYQLGSTSRLISPTRTDKDGNEVPNAEYKVISSEDICGDLDGKTVSEFDVSVASAIASGYEIQDDSDETHIVLKKENLTLVVIRAAGLIDGIKKLAESGLITGRNVVVATNGQYRTKDVIQTERVLTVLGIDTESITAIGDETGKRSAKIYCAELAVILRELSK